jgi:DNA polymerase-3 subunit delta
MKLAPREASAILDQPPAALPAILIYGVDPIRVAEKRARIVAARIGPQGAADLRLDRIDGASLRKDGAALADAVKAQGFFPGPRAVVVDEAADGAAPAIEAALAQWGPGDALLVVTAGDLKPTSKLRKLFESHKTARALPVYDDPPDRAEIERWLAAEGLTRLPPDAARDLTALAQTLDPGEFRQTLARIALYKLNDPAPLTPDEIATLAPAEPEAEVDELVAAVAAGDRARIAPLMARLAGQGVAPVAVAIALLRHIRLMHRLAGDPAGPEAAADRLRPPLNFRVKGRVLADLRRWAPPRLDEALAEAVALDLGLRSSAPVPARALAERGLLRIAGLARGG